MHTILQPYCVNSNPLFCTGSPRRVTRPGWAYAIYCMVHASTRDEVMTIVRRIADTVKPDDYEVIFSARQLKKTSVTLPF